MDKSTLKTLSIKYRNKQNDTWCKTTRRFMGDTLQTTMDDILEARNENSYIRCTIEDLVDPETRVLGRAHEFNAGHRILSKPSKAAMDGAIILVGANDTLISIKRPSDELVCKLSEYIDLAGLEQLYLPTSAIEWSFAVLTHYLSHEFDGEIALEMLVTLARFGEAQLYGSSEDTMGAVLGDLSSTRFHSHRQWKDILIGKRVVTQRSHTDFRPGLVRFTEPRGGRTKCLIHELDLLYYAQLVLEGLSEDIDMVWAWEVRKIHYQAGEEKIDVEDLELDEMNCPICLMRYENRQIINKGVEKCPNPKMKDLENEVLGEIGRETESQTIIETETFGPLYDMHKENAQPIKLKCGHTFGTTCIERWLIENNTCPLCRVTLVGDQRILKSISPEVLSTITEVDDARALLFCEDIDFDIRSHRVIESAIEQRNFCAFTHLEAQFQLLQQIDKRLGIVERKRIPSIDSPVARWMDRDWERFASNAQGLREMIKEYIRSQSKWNPDEGVLYCKRYLAEMLSACRERLQS